MKRVKIWRWMLEDFIAQLGDRADDFDLDAWVHRVDDEETRVLADVNWGAYWKRAFTEEVRRRGLPIAEVGREHAQSQSEGVLEILRKQGVVGS